MSKNDFLILWFARQHGPVTLNHILARRGRSTRGGLLIRLIAIGNALIAIRHARATLEMEEKVLDSHKAMPP